jgi:putative selenate reductase
MAELYPLSLTNLLRRIHYEWRTTRSIFDLPEKSFFKGLPGLDLSVCFHGRPAGTQTGPAAGPHTQLTQNIILSWLVGSRIMELKTVQINDRLEIPRPCIDAENIAYNVEFSQELRIEHSLREYVKAWMIIEILKAEKILGDVPDSFTRTIFDMSVGYNLAGIRQTPVTNFMRGLMDASRTIDTLRKDIPEEFARYRDHPFPTRVSSSITLSTFHGCPSDEVEKIVHHLLTEVGVNVVVKLNPTQLDRGELEEILNGRLGYDLEVNPGAYTSGLTLQEAIEMLYRMRSAGRARGLEVGAKLSNTLETVNRKGKIKGETIYASGQPLYVIATRLAERLREKVGADFELSFSAGIDKRNYADAVAMNFVPVTVCTDLLRPQGFARMKAYFAELGKRIAALGVREIPDYVLHQAGHADAAIAKARVAAAADPRSAQAEEAADEFFSKAADKSESLRDRAAALAEGAPEDAAKFLRGLPSLVAGWAGILNAPALVEAALADPYYHADRNSKIPNRIESKLYLFDCINCDKCIPVCPNDANFYYTLEPQRLPYRNVVITANGFRLAEEEKVLEVKKDHQLANYVDFCNECGNCDTFCPEYGGPFIEKPSWFSSLATWIRHRNTDGFFVDLIESQRRIYGRIKGKEYYVVIDPLLNRDTFTCDEAEVEFMPGQAAAAEEWIYAVIPRKTRVGQEIDLTPYFTMRILAEGVLRTDRINYVNTRFLPHRLQPT